MPESVSDRPTRAHETIFLFALKPGYFFDQEAVSVPYTKDGRKKTTVQQGPHSIQHRNGERWPGEGRNIRSVWELKATNQADEHYASYSLELPRLCITAGCPPGGVVFDPFLGTGTTARVALDLGRRSLGSELSEKYARMAVDRLGQQSLFPTLEV
jgi:DNA modification methylase